MAPPEQKAPVPHASKPVVVEPAPVARGPLPVRIASVPFGVTVEVDGKDVGRTPMRGIELSPGPHGLVFIDDGKRIEKSTNECEYNTPRGLVPRVTHPPSGSRRLEEA